jgi:pimeloyl-ACP methyl ester carboxylesterase
MATATAHAITRPFPEVYGVSHRFVEAGGLRFHVAEAGEGEPLVLLHGWPQHWFMWRHQIGPLAERFRVICPDLRGFGWSDAPASGYEKENLAVDVLKLLDALELDRVKLAGHDWGGWIGFLLCLRHPERVERFLALNIPPPWGTLDLRAVTAIWRFWYQAVLASPWLGARILRDRPEFIGFVLRGSTKDKETWTDAELDEFIEPLREPARAEATVQLYRSFLLREFPKIAQGAYESLRLETSTLLLFGVDDFAISTSMLRGYEPYVDDFMLELVPDCGHFIAEQRPQLVTERALEFFGAPDTVRLTSPVRPAGFRAAR